MPDQIYPCIWFNGNALEAAAFYIDVFPNSNIISNNPIVINALLSGQHFMLLNGGPAFRPNASISFYTVMSGEDEIERAWQKLTANGKVMMPLDAYPWSTKYGWVEDQYGVSWQLSLDTNSETGQVFTPTLMYANVQQGNAQSAIDFYMNIFPDSSLRGVLHYADQEGEFPGQIKHAQFSLLGQTFMAMDSGVPQPFSFTEGMSLVVSCADQETIDHYWSRLSEGGEEQMCGWLKDKFGVSWQIVPSILGELMADQERGGRVMQAFLKMKKFDIAQLMTA